MKPVIFFDWDGTLCDSMNLCIQENRSALLQMGLPDQPDDVLRRCNGPTYAECLPIIGVPAERMAEYCRTRLACSLVLAPKVNRLYPGAKELLTALSAKATLCIVSNGTREYLTLCQQVFGVEGMFHRVAHSRPDRTKTQNLAALIAELQPEKAVMVGDRIGDIRAGIDNGLPTIAAAFGYGSDEEYAHAACRADTMAELQALLLQFCESKGGQTHVH